MQNKERTFLKDVEVAALINLSVNTLRTWRRRGIGPRFIKAESAKGTVRYDLNDVNQWIEDSRLRGMQQSN